MIQFNAFKVVQLTLLMAIICIGSLGQAAPKLPVVTISHNNLAKFVVKRTQKAQSKRDLLKLIENNDPESFFTIRSYFSGRGIEFEGPIPRLTQRGRKIYANGKLLAVLKKNQVVRYRDIEFSLGGTSILSGLVEPLVAHMKSDHKISPKESTDAILVWYVTSTIMAAEEKLTINSQKRKMKLRKLLRSGWCETPSDSFIKACREAARL